MNKSLDTISIETLHLQIPASACWAVIGSISMVANALTIYTIAETKNLHSTCMWTLVSLSVTDFFCGLADTVIGSKKLYLSLNNIPETSMQYVCFLWMAPVMVFSTVSDFLTLALNIDRWLAITFPIFYKTKLTRWFVVFVNVFSWSFNIGFWGSGFIMENLYKLLPVCSALSTPDKWFQDLFASSRWLSIGPNLFFFLLILFTVRRKLLKTNALPAQERKRVRKEMEISMIKTLGVLLLVYITLKVLGNILVTYLVAVGGTLLITFIPFAAVPSVMYAASHFFIYLAMSKHFRRGFRINIWSCGHIENGLVAPVNT